MCPSEASSTSDCFIENEEQGSCGSSDGVLLSCVVPSEPSGPPEDIYPSFGLSADGDDVPEWGASSGVLLAKKSPDSDWGYVCDDQLGGTSTSVEICRFLGFDSFVSDQDMVELPTSSPFWSLFILECDGAAEPSECTHDEELPQTHCNSNEGFRLTCGGVFNPDMLMSGALASEFGGGEGSSGGDGAAGGDGLQGSPDTGGSDGDGDSGGSAGAVIGGVVAGVIVLAAVAAGTYYVLVMRPAARRGNI